MSGRCLDVMKNREKSLEYVGIHTMFVGSVHRGIGIEIVDGKEIESLHSILDLGC